MRGIIAALADNPQSQLQMVDLSGNWDVDKETHAALTAALPVIETQVRCTLAPLRSTCTLPELCHVYAARALSRGAHPSNAPSSVCVDACRSTSC